MCVKILSDIPVSRNLTGRDHTLTCAGAQTVVLSNGDFVCLYNEGREKHSHDGTLIMQTSSDG